MSAESKLFRIIVPGELRLKMSAWEISSDLRAAMQEKLNNLAQDPVPLLRKVTLPWEERANLYSFTIPDAAPNLLHLFTFAFFFGENEQDLIMHHCGYQLRNSQPPHDENRQQPDVE